MRKDVKCPYCNGEQDINHDDGYGYEENESHQQQCEHCDKTFVYTTSVHFHYETYQADCLNEGEHKWKPTITVPKKFTKMRCTICDEEREPTPDEFQQIMNA